MWFQIERESDRDGVRYYWSIFEGASDLRAASARHFGDLESAVSDAAREMRETFAREVNIPYRVIELHPE